MIAKVREDRWGGVIAGVILVALGASFLLDQFDLVARRLWSFWPLILVVLGGIKLASGRSWGARKGGIVLLSIGFWIWASQDGWGGLSWRTSWPLLLILFGGLAVVESLFGLKDEGSCS